MTGRQLTFELDDSRGNKVFRKITQTDSYGLASAEFVLADEVNLGTYHLRALLDNAVDAPPSSSEIALQSIATCYRGSKSRWNCQRKTAKANKATGPATT